MSIRIYDSMARRVVDLDTREPGRVAMYVCGPTVYNLIHIGNARTFVWFDLIRRYLIYRGFDVTYVMNYTDVDDRIIERAKLESTSADAITAKYAEAFEADMASLGTNPPDRITRATDHIDEMVDAVQGLVDKGIAYDSNGDVFFSVEDFEGYGKLSGRSLKDMREGARVEPHENKRHPLDFALWKSAKEDEPSWPSPWGPGRPGWHIECSVMSTKYLGMGFDIHGGGTDLIFPHHENEIAQAEALTGSRPFVRHWLHTGMVQMEAEKMSKSLGNVVVVGDAVERFGRDAVRYWALAGSYRTQIVFSEGTLNDAFGAHARWASFVMGARHLLKEDMPATPRDPRRPINEDIPNPYIARFVDAMDDDFNSAEAFATVHDLVREGNRALEAAQRGDEAARTALIEITGAFMELVGLLGFDFEVSRGSSDLAAGLIDYLIELRDQARAQRAFDRADAIRSKLSELGVAIEDTPAGTRWHLGAGGN
jgi:cysteinyl-tRNA synthetase